MANDFYQHSGHPGTRAPRSSALLRAEFAAIEDGFDKLPDVSTANMFSVSDGSALVGKTVAQAKVLLALENVTNTADADKPISTLTQAALDLKQAALDLKAPLASPVLTGTPTAPTADAGDSSTTVATTAFVASGLALKAPLDSPSLTGNPTAPTQVSTDDSTKLATTAFVRDVFPGSTGLSYQSFPNGITIQWGSETAHATANTAKTHTFGVAFGSIYSLVVTPMNINVGVDLRAYDLVTTGFKSAATLGGLAFRYIAVGWINPA